MNVLRTSILAACVCGAPALARAQHADISPRVSGGRLVADAFEDATGTLTPDARVYGYDFQEDPLDPYFASDPGFNAFAGSGLPANSLLLFKVPDASRFGLPGNLSYWGGSGAVSFGAVPAGETFRLALGAQSRTVGGAAGDVTGFAIGTAGADGSLHRHLNSFLQGPDGNSDPSDGVVPADGIYLLPVQLTSGDASVSDSQPLFLVFNNGLSEEAHDRAIDYVRTTIVPEPSAALVAVAGMALLGRRRRRA